MSYTNGYITTSINSQRGKHGERGIGFNLTNDNHFHINNRRLTNVSPPVNDNDAVTKKFMSNELKKKAGTIYVTNELNKKMNTSNSYTKTEINNTLATKADLNYVNSAEDGIECICSGMQKYSIDESLNVLGYELEQMQENKIEFNTKDFLIELEERIDDIFTNMISELKPRINKLHHKIKRKYIGEEKKSRKIFSYDYEHKKQLNLLKPFVEDKSVFHPAVVRWN